MNWLLVLNAIGAVQGLFLAAVLTGRRTDAPANRWLALFLAAYSLILLQDVSEQSRLLRRLPHLANVASPLLFLLGPLLWRYVAHLTAPAERARSFLLHCIPAGLLILLFVPFYSLPAAEKLRVLETEWAQPGFQPNVQLLLLMLQISIYLALCISQVRRYHRGLGDFYSNVEKRRVDWLWRTLAAGLGLFAVWLLATWTQQSWANVLDALAFPVVIYLLGYLALRQPQALSEHTEESSSREESASAPNAAETLVRADEVGAVSPNLSPVLEPSEHALQASTAEANGRKYEKSALSAETVAHYRVRIEAHVAMEKPYLENDLTLAQLAQRLDMSQHHLSQMLNVHFGLSFFDFINAHRVEEVKRCLGDVRFQKQTILEIALASGFNSKATFNATFKKFTGQTPSDFRQSSNR